MEHIHAHSYIHRDIKPENFLVGLEHNSNTIYIIDYGLAKRFEDKYTRKHIPYKDNKALTGTLRYVSLPVHLGSESSRRDDLESLGYLLIYFLNGRLPWQGLKIKGQSEKMTAILEKKLCTPLATLCKNLPNEFEKYMKIVREYKFEQKPDYNELRGLFKNLYSRLNPTNFMFDWTAKYVFFISVVNMIKSKK